MTARQQPQPFLSKPWQVGESPRITSSAAKSNRKRRKSNVDDDCVLVDGGIDDTEM